MDAGEDRRVANRRPPAFRSAELAHQLAESREVVGLIRDQEIHVIDAEGVGQQLADLLVAMSHLHVLVHHLLPSLLVEEIPVGALGERIHDQVLRAFAAEERLLLGRRALHVLRRPDDAQKALAWRHPRPHTGPEQVCVLCLERFERGAKTPEQQVDSGLQADHRVREGGHLRASGHRVAELFRRPAALFPGLPPPLGVEAKRKRVHVAGFAHGVSRSHVAASAEKYVITVPAPARTMAVSDSSTAPRRSTQPRSAAASIIAASPLTWYAASGRSKRCRARSSRSSEVRAGLTMRMSAPSSTSSSISRIASRPLAESIWYDLRSPKLGAEPAASRNGP